MDTLSPQGWFFRFAIAAVVPLLVYAAFAVAGPKAPPLPTSREGAGLDDSAIRNSTQRTVPDVLLVGSSLTARLRGKEYFDTPNLAVLGLAGGSPITGLEEITLGRDRLPGTVLIEMNVLDRGEDAALVRRFTRSGGTFTWPRPIRSAVAFYERWLHAPPDRLQLKANAAALLQTPPSDFDNHIYVELALRQSSIAPSNAVMTHNIATLQRLVAEMKARGSRVYFYSLPYAEALQNSASATATAAIAHAVFADDRQWLHFEYSDPGLAVGGRSSSRRTVSGDRIAMD